MSQKQIKRPKAPGEPDSDAAFKTLQRPDVSDVIKDAEQAEGRAAKLLKESRERQKKRSPCGCGGW